jgi:hypothetical protein
MSTKATTTITYNTIKGAQVRSINIAKRKYYFISDLTKIYGRGFVSKLSTEPLIRRVKDGSVSQDRRLVNVTEFKQVIRQTAKPSKVANKLAQKTTKATVGRVEAEQFMLDLTPKETDTSSKTQKTATASNLSNLHIDLKDVRNVDEVERGMIKGQILGLVNRHLYEKAEKEGWTDEQLEQNNREKYRETYTALYREFDRVLLKQLATEGKTLQDYGLGIEGRGQRQNYLDRLDKQGLLPQFLEVAKQMFGYKLAKSK